MQHTKPDLGTGSEFSEYETTGRENIRYEKSYQIGGKAKENPVEVEMERERVSLEAFSDASLGTLDEGKLQIGHAIGLVN